MTIVFPGTLCTSLPGQTGVIDPLRRLGHIRLDAAGLLRWLNATDPVACKEQFYGKVDSDATVSPANARQIAVKALKELGLEASATQEEVRIAIEKKGVAIIR
jgi:hypothetical protein